MKNKESAVIKWLKEDGWTTVTDGEYTYHFKKNSPYFYYEDTPIKSVGYSILDLSPDRATHKISGKSLESITWINKTDGFMIPKMREAMTNWIPNKKSGKVHNHERDGKNLYHVTYYYLATGMEGNADESCWGYWWANSAEEARDKASNGDSFARGCLSAKLTPNNTIPTKD